MIIFFAFYQYFKILSFEKKITENPSIKIVGLPFDFIKKITFSIDNDSQYFASENHVLYWKNGFQKILEVKKKFSQQCQAVSRSTPPHRVAEKTSKSAKFYLWELRQKLEKHDYQSWNGFYQNFRKNTYLWGFWRKFPNIRQSFKG